MPLVSCPFLIAKSTSINCCADETLEEPLITAAGDRCLSPTSRIAAADIVSVAVVNVAAVGNAGLDHPETRSVRCVRCTVYGTKA